ncbi:uncharacterized protein PITG_11511 [Phytophthora infestans T30-4]|uniref:Uncharacterized protein n=1 Tax=Phytophthora infestans (strain T30-4) TaxID=403677 RepID=D0NIY4_PHYIT|nr:uncharacterized protein PITG_11511 [Phytophthora infestans T30-4]EEY59468.1 conserved hypothetical protein [Phytophthora infestans T30-4]|eukprot:XP_002901078.1 conserved hypothetical protein [Phytophthora infestans T30-4]
MAGRLQLIETRRTSRLLLRVLRDAVKEYALAVPGAQVSTVPDLVGIDWLQQLAARDDESKTMVNALMDRLRLDSRQKDVGGSIGEQVDIYDTLCDLAAQTLACKYAVVSLVDENRQWFKSAVNVKESEVPRDFGFCEYSCARPTTSCGYGHIARPTLQDGYQTH